MQARTVEGTQHDPADSPVQLLAGGTAVPLQACSVTRCMSARAVLLPSASQIYCIENAHGQLVRDLDFNPNKQYYLASCGDDCKVKFWDTRNVTEPVKTLEEHSHWYCGSHPLEEGDCIIYFANYFTIWRGTNQLSLYCCESFNQPSFIFPKEALIPNLNVCDL